MSLSDPDGGGGRALADTSVFIAVEQDSPLSARPPGRLAVSVITIGELRLGVLAAAESATRSRRLETLSMAEQLEPLPVDARVSRAWAALRVALRDSGIRLPINDSWIAATAIALDLPVATQDSDYDGVPGLDVLRV
jgi:predicted nucleic acid-binding protein